MQPGHPQSKSQTAPTSTSRTPPIHLIDRVLAIGDLSESERLESFVQSGQRSLFELERALASCDQPLGQFHDVLDWGCGPGRVTLRVLDKYPSLHITGIDTDAGPIDWLRSAVPEATFLTVDPSPPTQLPPTSFDLVINQSVLTHIDHEAQKAWMAEIARVTRPNGIFVTSVHGVYAFIHSLRQLENGFANTNPWLSAWRTNRFVFVAEDAFTGSSHHEGYHTTFQDGAGLEAIGDYEFEVLATFSKGYLWFQDLVVLRRRTADEVAERRSIEPPDNYVHASAALVASDDDSRLARLERTSMLASMSLGQLGRQIARLEEAVALAAHSSARHEHPLPEPQLKRAWRMLKRVGAALPFGK
jgi:SAM-dependent methyltransferase